MAKAELRLDLHQGGARLTAVARELRRMDGRQVKEIFRTRLEAAAKPYPPRVRASVLAIPTTGDKHTGLRARIAQCVEVSSGTDTKSAYASIWINPMRMQPDYTTLPLYMEGVSEGRRRRYVPWRHPVYGTEEQELGARGHGRGWTWTTQAAHPYFQQAASGFGRAAGDAIREALDDITRKISG